MQESLGKADKFETPRNSKLDEGVKGAKISTAKTQKLEYEVKHARY